MAIASTPTLLALDRYAQIMGLNPAHFNGAYGPSGEAAPMPMADCSEFLTQYPWQANDKVSREELAEEIAQAEKEISDVLGYPPAPMWICEEVIQYPQHHRSDVFSDALNVQGMPPSLRAKYGKISAGGRRQPDFIANVTTPVQIQFLNLDGDTWDETVRITYPTSLTDACEIKVYFADHDGDPEWEIRPARSKTITGGNVVIDFWAWQFIDPDQQNALPTETRAAALNLNDAIYVDNVDLYQVYNDTTADSAEFYWEPTVGIPLLDLCDVCGGAGCAACTYTTQLGCLHVRDAHRGLIVPMAGTYSASSGWVNNPFSRDRRPDFVKVWYYAGDIDNRRLCSFLCDPLSNNWAKAIAYLATARLRRPLCGCGAVQERMTNLQREASFTPTHDFFVPTSDELKNPFGMKVGEIMAWRMVKQAPRKLGVALA